MKKSPFYAFSSILFLIVIALAAVFVSDRITQGIRFDFTERKQYTLDKGTLNILKRLKENDKEIEITLYYTESAARKAIDEIRFFDTYFIYVRDLLMEMASKSGGAITLTVVDPQPYSDAAREAVSHGIQRFPLSNNNMDLQFSFGLMMRMVEKREVIPFFQAQRQQFAEYDIARLLSRFASDDSKPKIGIISGLPVLGDGMDPRMAQMMGQRSQPPWIAFRKEVGLNGEFDFELVKENTDISPNYAALMIIHPKDLSDRTLFAIDQYLLTGGKVIAFVDPVCHSDAVPIGGMPGMPSAQIPGSSNLNTLFRHWGAEVLDNMFAVDREHGLVRQENGKNIYHTGFFTAESNQAEPSVADIKQVQFVYPGAIQHLSNVPGITFTPLFKTSAEGAGLFPFTTTKDWERDRKKDNKLIDSKEEPVVVAAKLTGKFQSAFPDGVKYGDNTITGITSSSIETALFIVADVDVITDQFCFSSFFGMIAINGQNFAMLQNLTDDVASDGDLLRIRTRGGYARPFTAVDALERKQNQNIESEIKKLDGLIQHHRNELNQKAGEGKILMKDVETRRREIEQEIRKLEIEKYKAQGERYRAIEAMGNYYKYFNTLLTPTLIALIAIGLGIWRSMRAKRYSIDRRK